MLSQEALEAAVHGQDWLLAVKDTWPVAPVLAAVPVSVLIVNVQVMPDWVTVNCDVLTVIVPAR